MISHSQGSFQRDSAFLTLKGCHYTRSRPAMATGRPLVISLARYATPIRQYSVSPQSFAAWRARPSAQFMGWFSAVQRRGPILPPRCRAVEKEAQRYTPPRLHPTSSVWLFKCVLLQQAKILGYQFYKIAVPMSGCLIVAWYHHRGPLQGVGLLEKHQIHHLQPFLSVFHSFRLFNGTLDRHSLLQ